jgi:hypothetical protein
VRIVSGKKRIVAVTGTLLLLLLLPDASAKRRPEHPYRYSIVDMSVSLAIGTVRTPEFAPPAQWYWIMLQVEKPLPFRDMQCLTGVEDGTDDFKDCPKKPLIGAEWTVLSDGQVVSKGSSAGFGGAKFTNEYIFKFLGSFPTLPGKKYVVEVKFTKDGTQLNVANPHLIVVKLGDE